MHDQPARPRAGPPTARAALVLRYEQQRIDGLTPEQLLHGAQRAA